ncbi:lipid phosphate phosphatase 1 [Parachaetomium inaequale]|uniref:Lipid phosphate phosphatase 1 n=1 Tax=Parachaetomium inaequale TaxID=2588326 RepID=A0AAN6P486_9PEZI|nr:lipid phosphate phosphatase 1 [Parachaetomium inaequale]
MLPFHRRDARREPAAATTDKPPLQGGTMRQRLVPFVIDWVKVSWRDILTMAVLGAATLGIYRAPYAATRNFPITFDASGDIVYPQFAYPNRGWIISPSLSGVICTIIPIGIMALAQLRIRSFWDFNNAVLGLLYSLILSSLFQVIIKTLIGGFRPIFLDVCRPDPSLAQSHNATGLNGVGFHSVMYTSEVCTNPDKDAVKNAMTSFPSGHATTAFAAYVFLFLWMNAKLKVWANFHATFYWLAALLAPLLGATLMAACLTVDQAHNWYDVCMGVLIGTIVAFMVYRVSYAAVWDWRYNHIPLRHRQVFDYAALAPEVMERALFVRKLGWGRKKGRGGRRGVFGRGKPRVGSNASSATYARNGGASMEVPPAQGGVSYPNPATVRPNGTGQNYGRGEDMV